MPNLKQTRLTMARYSRFILVFIFIFIFLSVQAFCCTSVIISGNARADGRPVMYKHRDTGELNNRMQWFRGPEYCFIALVNSSAKEGEAWAGTNSAGFCIMNTATYDLKDDSIPEEMMDQEGKFMYKALGVCADQKDFEHFLDTLSKPYGVEANFGIIDAHGGASYYEVNNYSYRRFDVADEPGGYMVVTNFTRSGREKDRKGVDRWEKCKEICAGLDMSTVGHKELFNSISRSGKPIQRNISSAAIIFEGVSPGEDPLRTVAWTILGCPTTCIYIPLKVFTSDHIPAFMKEYRDGDNAQICSQALVIKGIYGFEKGCIPECQEVEEFVDSKFKRWMNGPRYDKYVRKVYHKYKLMYTRKLPKVVHKLADVEKND